MSANHRRRHNSGFSLLEILIVLGIVGVLVASISSRITKSENREIRKNVRTFSTTLRDLRNKARMRSYTYRLVINMPESKEEKQAFWIESTGKNYLVTYDEDALKKKQEELKEGAPDPSGFEIDAELSKEGPKPLPEGLYFESVELAAQKKEYTSGRIYIHFFPEGRVEEAIVHLGNRDKLHWSLAIHPLTGQVEMYSRDQKLKDSQITDGQSKTSQ